MNSQRPTTLFERMSDIAKNAMERGIAACPRTGGCKDTDACRKIGGCSARMPRP